MAAYTFTPGDVIAPTGGAFNAVAGVALAAGDLIYLDASDSNKAKLAQSDGAVAQAAVVGICVNSAAIGQPIMYNTGGVITVDAASFATVGELLVLSADAGDLSPALDLATGDYVSILGWVLSANTFQFSIKNTGVQHA